MANGRCSWHWQRVGIPYLQKGHLEIYRLVSLTLIPGKMLEKMILEAIAWKTIFWKDKKAIWGSQQGFMKEKSCITNPVPFYDERTSLVDEESAVDVAYLNFSEAFDHFSHNNLIGKLMKHRPCKWPVRCAEMWLNYWAQRVVISITKSSWRPLTSGVMPVADTGTDTVQHLL